LADSEIDSNMCCTLHVFLQFAESWLITGWARKTSQFSNWLEVSCVQVGINPLLCCLLLEVYKIILFTSSSLFKGL